MRIVIAGAGIGGLTAATLLAHAGHDVALHEKAGAFGAVGAGIQISPNGCKVLAGSVSDGGLGLGEGLHAIGTRPARARFRRWDDDRVLMTNPLGDGIDEQFGFPYLNVYRPELIDLLGTAAIDAGVDVHFRSAVIGAQTNHDGASVTLVDGSTAHGDLLIGADGIHSPVRNACFGTFPSRFSGSVAYRALVPRAAVAHLPIEVTNRVGPDRHIVSYFVGRDQSYFNLVCVVPESAWDLESWTEPGSLAELRSHFAGWSSELNGILDHIAEPVFRWALYDRDPLPEWTTGNVALLGDACHPMLPFMAQGACQAIEDAAILTRCITEFDLLADALHAYETVRKPRATEVQRRSRANSVTFHLPDGPDQQRRDDTFATVGGGSAGSAMAWLYGYDPLTAPLR